MDHTEYPECEKLSAVSDERRTLSDFIEWLESKNLWICDGPGELNHYYPVSASGASLIMQFLEIDQDNLEQERRAMIAGLQEEQPEAACEHPKDLYAPHCTEIACPNYAGGFVR